MRIIHPLDPIFDKNSKSLILGSMPSITSRQEKKYYANKYNRFWKVLERIYKEDSTDWKNFIIRHHLALWDVVASCEIEASMDSTIKKVVPNDIKAIIMKTKIKNIFVLGNKAYELYNRYILPEVKIEAILLPSTSSANARLSEDDLVKKYMVIKNITDKDD